VILDNLVLFSFCLYLFNQVIEFLNLNTLVFLGNNAVPLILYGFQHYLSITGSIVFFPLIIVPAMGGRDVNPSYLQIYLIDENYVIIFSIKSDMLSMSLAEKSERDTFVLLLSGRYCKSGFDSSFIDWIVHFDAYIPRFKVTTNTRGLLCLSCSSSNYNQLYRTPKHRHKCMYDMNILFFAVLLLRGMYI
jgi:nucleobase transporter 1/2